MDYGARALARIVGGAAAFGLPMGRRDPSGLRRPGDDLNRRGLNHGERSALNIP